MFVACGGGKPVIKLYDGQWESLAVVNAIFRLIAEEGYGYRVETVVSKTFGMQSALPTGEMDSRLVPGAHGERQHRQPGDDLRGRASVLHHSQVGVRAIRHQVRGRYEGTLGALY